MVVEGVQDIKARERSIYNKEEADKRVGKADTENKTENRYIGKGDGGGGIIRSTVW